jgi:two-component system chemotaxis sensor kinase CheA
MSTHTDDVTSGPAGDPDGFDMAQFQGAFFEEAAEHLAAMETLLVGIDVAAPGADALDAIFRAAHSIKGGSGMFGFNETTTLTHELESLLDRVRRGEVPLSQRIVDVLLQSSDLVRAQLAHYAGRAPAPATPTASMCKRIHACDVAVGPAGAHAAAQAHRAVAPLTDAVAEPATRTVVLTVPVAALDDATMAGLAEQLAELGALREVSRPARPRRGKRAAAAPRRFELTTAASDEVILTLFEFVMDSSSVGLETTHRAPTPAPADGVARTLAGVGVQPSAHPEPDRPFAAADSSIRVSVEKVDLLINQVGELVITQAMLAQSIAGLDACHGDRLMAALADLDRNTRSLQASVMSIRMLPIAFVFNRFPRLVRDLAAKLGKQVRLVTHGEGTELDKGLIEKISDPLTHLVRNALDHGIEDAHARSAAGKPAAGTLTLRAFHRGGNVLIEVADDGAGLSRERILAKARERGLPPGDAMSDADVWGLIFEPGFSTAEFVTDVSGRGVGMDVVRRNIGELGGTIDIDSVPGHGTRITVRLPLTLAIMDGMSVAIGAETYILPLASIVESLQVGDDQVRSVAGRGLVIDVRGEYLPVVSMHELFVNGPVQGARASGTMVIVESDGTRIALLVDALLGQHQVVVKSLDANYRKVHGISGATIMGDGRVALILDPAALTRNRRQPR